MSPMRPIADRSSRDWLIVIWIAACILLLPVGRSVELPMLLLAIAGLAMLLRQPAQTVRSPPARTLILLFACIWLPMLVAELDAATLDTLRTNVVFPRFLLMGLFMILVLAQAPERIERLTLLLGVALAFWAVDGLIQGVWGRNLWGDPLIHGQVTGVFYPKQNIGQILAVLFPVFLYWVSVEADRRPWMWAFIPVYMAVILLSGKRSAWIMLAVALAVLGAATLVRLPRQRRWRVAAGVLALVLAGGLALGQHSGFKAKAEVTAGLFSGDMEKADLATSYRLGIWRVGQDIFRDHWINGIGPRGFRAVYPHYAPADDRFVLANPASGPTHPHLIVLEVAVEAGVLGLIGFAILWLWLLRALWQARRDATALAWLTALAVAILPFNTGLALYGSVWSGIVFWLMIMAVIVRWRASAAQRKPCEQE